MKFGLKTLLAASIVTAIAGCSATGSSSSSSSAQLTSAVADSARSDKNRARDQYRRPAQTLEFFGLKPNMTVVEIAPGGGWYSEILAPAVKGQGLFMQRISLLIQK